MIRHAAALAVVLCLVPAWAGAQSPVLTVKVDSANVHKGPSTGSPVIGRAPRGASLEVTRNLGDWVKVAWASAPDAVGYVHLSAGTLGPHPSAPAPAAAATRTTARAAFTPRQVPASTPAARPADAPPLAAHDHVAQTQSSLYIAPPRHFVGLGGRVNGATLGYGGSARAWSRNRLGLQLDVSRYALTSTTMPGRVTSVHFGPSVLYSLPDRVSDYFWLRPYVGGGLSLTRSSQTGFESTSKTGLQAFGGAEVTFASMPRFALSADAGYRQSRTPFDGFEIGGVNFSIAGHWYVR